MRCWIIIGNEKARDERKNKRHCQEHRGGRNFSFHNTMIFFRSPFYGVVSFDTSRKRPAMRCKMHRGLSLAFAWRLGVFEGDLNKSGKLWQDFKLQHLRVED